MLLKKTTVQHTITTEKTFKLMENGFYTFKVDSKACKNNIEAAIFGLFGTKPISVNTINVKPSTRFFRGRKGQTQGYKKAIVKMPADFKIEDK
jgi:large subunit ribosomal protein L23